jgi:hypothetical protein
VRGVGAGLIALLPLLGPSCGKVGLVRVFAEFQLADVTWFEEEQTMFVFYEVVADQGLGDPSVVEITYTTDEEVVDWVPVSDLPTVHTHLPVDCGVDALCGSASLHVPGRPRDVALRLRYHRDGEMSLDPDTAFYVVDAGVPHRSRSLLVYGVFDETNRYLQWRARHQFPGVRNEQATELGLRREFEVRDAVVADRFRPNEGNPYGYGIDCPLPGVPLLPSEPVSTDARAVFHPEPLPAEAGSVPYVCAQSTVTDALGEFTTGAVAQKNPEVRPAFPLLQSVVRDAVPVPFFLAPCDRVISEEHEEMQRQRLQLEGVPTTCIDDWAERGFVDRMVSLFRDAVEAQRVAGEDMVLTIAVHQDEPGVSQAIEEALAEVVPPERHRTSPRLAGAFVLDSTITGLQRDELEPVVLWCPADIPFDELPNASQISCAILPDNPDLSLGPLSVSALPILPSRDQYLDYIDTYSVGRAGFVKQLAFRVPEFSTIADHVDLGAFGVVTFLDGERIDARPADAFSYCEPETLQPFVFRTDLMRDPYVLELLSEDCEQAGLPREVCDTAAAGLLPLEYIADWHDLFGERSYELGVFWEFPFLLQMEYEVAQAGALTAFGFSVPFGVRETATGLYGAEVWTVDSFDLTDLLTQCTRYCDHPTFGSAGVYRVYDDFRSTYRRGCYAPLYPVPGDGGFPVDP